MATLSLTTHFTVDIPDDDSHTITGGSTTATDSITITHYFDKRYSITNTTLTEIWNDTMLADFDFLWVEADQTVELQLVCNEGGEFVLQTPLGNIERKLSSGEAVIFPIIYPHGVKRITKGERENIIGWLSSNVTYEQSFLLHTMYEVNTYLMDQNKEMFLKSTLIQTYLKKEWGK